MSSQSLILRALTFAYPSSSRYLFEDFSLQFNAGWTGIVGPNGLGKTTLLRLTAGELEPVQGHIECHGRVAYCPQRTDNPPPAWDDFMEAIDSRACMWRGRLHVDPDWRLRWSTLSQGQRKRAQVAVALWHPVHALVLDEPTNHMDQAGRRIILQALAGFRGIGLIVSHDRQLLDTLCVQTLCVESTGPVLRPGGYSEAMGQAEADHQQRQSQRARLKQKLGKLNREMSARARAAGQADAQRSKRKLQHKDHDAKSKRDQARVSGKDGQAGRKLSQMAGKHRHLQQALNEAFAPKQAGMQLSLPSQTWPGDHVLCLAQGQLPLGPYGRLDYPELQVQAQDRIGLTGDNGTGKTRLLQWLVTQLTLPQDRYVYVPQEISADQGLEIVRKVRTLPKEQLGLLMTIVSSLGSDPVRLLETNSPSPGEMRKLLLASSVIKSPYMIIMDEPTNHLDLPSVRALERALNTCACALILVSHDQVFLDSLTKTRWNIQTLSSDSGALRTRLVVGDLQRS
jgi:macrolide transport system ATP-binding/permease protein